MIAEDSSFVAKKRDDATTVGTIDGSLFGYPFNICVKRFNDRGLVDFFLRKIAGSRAKRLWRISSRLYRLGLAVPQPLTYQEPTLGQRHSCYLSAEVEKSDSLGSIYKKGRFSQPERIARLLGIAVGAWHMSGAVHGDLKWSNILMREEGDEIAFFFVDLDRAKISSSIKMRGINKDLVRFYRYGLEIGAEDWIRSRFFPAYLSALSDHVRNKIHPDSIRDRAWRDWKRKGYRTFGRGANCSQS
jgi:tRNA A-37 threonylcarbamoyl transferase component Bud32